MRRYLNLALVAVIGILGLSSPRAVLAGNPSPVREEGSPVPLFNGKDLSGWYTFLPRKDGSDPRQDPKRVFRIEDGVLHVTGDGFGYICTDQEHENYRIKLEFKWGPRRYPPRESSVRDSGLLLHVVGEDKIWPKCIEFQIQEHDCGDFWLVGGTSIDVDGKTEKSYRKKTVDAEKPTGEWNSLEAVCDGDTITNIVNGQVVNRCSRASLTRGKIALQTEGAEVFFRNLVLTSLK
jgi:Domain of Unknown Function (DUF1080)